MKMEDRPNINLTLALAFTMKKKKCVFFFMSHLSPKIEPTSDKGWEGESHTN